ncbi:MAG: helix-turn-helix transcriptional regulator [Rhodospirillales bacterium]
MRRSPPAPPPETVGTRIRDLRRAGGLTQEQLAIACGVSRSAVAQWETDRAGQLRGNISRIAAALGANVEFLLEGERPPSGLTGDELAMMRLYRACDAEDRAFLLRTARKLAEPREGERDRKDL